jgi:hypothetical protein
MADLLDVSLGFVDVAEAAAGVEGVGLGKRGNCAGGDSVWWRRG